jgi:hypothetical protein
MASRAGVSPQNVDAGLFSGVGARREPWAMILMSSKNFLEWQKSLTISPGPIGRDDISRGNGNHKNCENVQ